ncbi:four helix bundle protein [Candidatus Woesebacteria bacterium]|nr:four helix bundle protein [Candidatus Woesebacteria bacterium]
MDQSKRDIYERIYKFAVNTILYIRKFPKTLEASVIAKQLIRSATSIGANAQEADGSESKAEFIHRFSIAKKEAKETSYWLRISEEVLGIDNSDLRKEVREITLILSAIIKKIKFGSSKFENLRI